MSHKKLRPFIVKVPVYDNILGYFPLFDKCIYIPMGP